MNIEEIFRVYTWNYFIGWFICRKTKETSIKQEPRCMWIVMIVDNLIEHGLYSNPVGSACS
jgi:hypothetical protein